MSKISPFSLCFQIHGKDFMIKSWGIVMAVSLFLYEPLFLQNNFLQQSRFIPSFYDNFKFIVPIFKISPHIAYFYIVSWLSVSFLNLNEPLSVRQSTQGMATKLFRLDLPNFITWKRMEWCRIANCHAFPLLIFYSH